MEEMNNVEVLENEVVNEVDVIEPENTETEVSKGSVNGIAALVVGVIGAGIVGGLALKKHLKKRKAKKQLEKQIYESDSKEDEEDFEEVEDAETEKK